LVFTINQKNRALNDLRSDLLEPPLQRVYHVVFAKHTSNNTTRCRAKAAVASGVKDQSGREALDLFVAKF